MSFVEITNELLNKTLTENGDKTYKSTLSPCLDYFALCGGKRFDLPNCASLFVKAFMDDKKTALKLLFYTRDIKRGLGERRMFRFLFNSLCNSYPEIAKELVAYIITYGRYDDLLCVLGTPVEDVALEIISKQLEEDIKNKKENKPISLLAKWLPSINTSNKETREFALYLCQKLNISKADYRKTLSFLRKDLIIENNLREKDYTFNYECVPSMAMKKYSEAFSRNDGERFEKYLESVNQGTSKMNVEVLDVVSFISKLRKAISGDKYDDNYFETTWKEVVKLGGEIDKRVLVMRDGSGSMTCRLNSYGLMPLDIADAMALLTSERLTGEFHNKFITFSSEPKLVDLSKLKTIKDKFIQLRNYNDFSNTNIKKVYQLILDVYKSKDFKKEDALDQILIVSDMQFDYSYECDDNDELLSTFEYFKKEFEALDYKMPEIIFWNVNAFNDTVPVTQNELGVKLVSGASKNIIDLVVKNDSLDPYDFMNKVLSKYGFIDEIFKGDL